MENRDLFAEHKKKLRSAMTWIVAVWIVAIIFGIALSLGWMPAIDLPILSWIHANRLSRLQQLMHIITLAGTWPVYVIVLALLALILLPRKQSRSWLILTLNTALTWGMNNLLKIIFRRERPFAFFQIEQGGLSYPSGHAMVAVAFYLLAALMIYKAWPRFRWLSVVIAVAGFLPGLSRLFMGVHYPSDVIMGWLLGLSAAYFWYGLWLKTNKEEKFLNLLKRSLHAGRSL